MTALFDVDAFRGMLKTDWMGRKLEFFEECDSTNERARQASAGSRPPGTLYLAESQSVGRGRWGRRWESGAGKSLLLTLVLEKPSQEVTGPRVGVALGLALARACEGLGVEAKIKWPNDLMASGRKLAGMLMESIPGGLAAGIGLNVNQARGDFGPEIEASATSLAIENGQPLSREALLASILLEMEQGLERLGHGGFNEMKKEWHRRAMYLGDPVQVKIAGEQGQSLEGTMMGLDFDGSLLLRLDHGPVLPVAAGDLLNLRPVLT